MQIIIPLILIGIPLMYLYLIMPRLHNPDAGRLIEYYYAHRGLHNSEYGIPENSLAAFERAIDTGYGIELDIQLTRDNIPVVFHDATLTRMCGINQKVSDMTLAQLKNLRLGDTEQQIPTFAEALAFIGGRVPLIVELKMYSLSCRDCALLHAPLLDYTGTYSIESFNPFVLNWYRKYHPRIIRGQLATNFIREEGLNHIFVHFILKSMMLNWLSKPDFIAYDWKYRHELSMWLCHRLYRATTVAWTIRDRFQMDQCRKHYDTVIFENFLPQTVPAAEPPPFTNTI